jgi:hypothetical protein
MQAPASSRWFQAGKAFARPTNRNSPAYSLLNTPKEEPDDATVPSVVRPGWLLQKKTMPAQTVQTRSQTFLDYLAQTIERNTQTALCV